MDKSEYNRAHCVKIKKYKIKLRGGGGGGGAQRIACIVKNHIKEFMSN